MSRRVDGTKRLAFPPQRENICAGIHMRVNRSECSRGDYAMTNLDRRQLLAGAAAVGATTALSPFPTSTATAAVPASGAEVGNSQVGSRASRSTLSQSLALARA